MKTSLKGILLVTLPTPTNASHADSPGWTAASEAIKSVMEVKAGAMSAGA